MARRLYSHEVAPSAARLVGSLRDIGYDFQTAIADLIDNSIAAGASRIEVEIEFSEDGSWVSIADDGAGMTANGLIEALRFGTNREYPLGDLGRFGLGLKTASLSQCRRLTVVTRHAPGRALVSSRTIDLDVIERFDAWLVIEDKASPVVESARERLASSGPGTVVVWEDLDRVLPYKRPNGGWAKRRLAQLADKTKDHLAMVFHRFIEGAGDREPVVLVLNGEKVRAWNPFAPDEPDVRALAPLRFEVPKEAGFGSVQLRRYVLPARDRFTSIGEFERMSGPAKWNRQQGIYVYRASRLIQWGGWSGMRAIDEHTKLARASLDFDTDMDSVFHVNVAKMKVSIPQSLRQGLEKPIHELCVQANAVYRRSERPGGRPSGKKHEASGGHSLGLAGLAIRAAALEQGSLPEVEAALTLAVERNPELSGLAGLG